MENAFIINMQVICATLSIIYEWWDGIILFHEGWSSVSSAKGCNKGSTDRSTFPLYLFTVPLIMTATQILPRLLSQLETFLKETDLTKLVVHTSSVKETW